MATMMMAGIGFGIDKLFGKKTPAERSEDLYYPEETLRDQAQMTATDVMEQQRARSEAMAQRIDALSMRPGGVAIAPSKSSMWDTSAGMSEREMEEWKERMLSDMLRVREKAEAAAVAVAQPEPDSVTITKESMLNLLDHVKSLEERVKAIEVNTHHDFMTETEVAATEERLFRTPVEWITEEYPPDIPTPTFVATEEDTYHLDMTDTPLVDGDKI
jgi:hypothetical protein